MDASNKEKEDRVRLLVKELEETARRNQALLVAFEQTTQCAFGRRANTAIEKLILKHLNN